MVCSSLAIIYILPRTNPHANPMRNNITIVNYRPWNQGTKAGATCWSLTGLGWASALAVYAPRRADCLWAILGTMSRNIVPEVPRMANWKHQALRDDLSSVSIIIGTGMELATEWIKRIQILGMFLRWTKTKGVCRSFALPTQGSVFGPKHSDRTKQKWRKSRIGETQSWVRRLRIPFASAYVPSDNSCQSVLYKHTG